MNPALLEALARGHGIELSYRDIWSHERRAEPGVLASLLQAMGVDTTSDASLERALREQQRAHWQRVVPTYALAAGSSVPIALRLPAGLWSRTLRWRVVEERGTAHEGPLRACDCRELERVSLDGTDHAAFEWRLPLSLPDGYHRLLVLDDDRNLGDGLLIAAPAACHRPLALRGGARVWGVTVQLYAVRSARNWGIGDFTDLAAAIDHWGRRGAATVGVNPLHALFPHDPAHASPYSPSSRRFLNALYLDVEAVAEFADCAAARDRVREPAFQAQLSALRETPLVDYPAVARLKWPLLEQLFEHFEAHHLAPGTPRGQAFMAFCDDQGVALQRHACFEALQQRFFAADASVWGWPVWPPEYRHPDSPEVRRFADTQRSRVQFFAYVQWLCDEQLGAVARRAREWGIGLYNDLAVAADRAGADAWSDQRELALQASIGAPPDEFNAEGQDWGLPPPIPRALEHSGFEAFACTLRAAMRHAGALRLDHAMSLMRLYWTAGGGTHGAFVHYPFEALLAIVRLESVRHRCMVIGETLGTVPSGLRERLADAGVRSYRVLLFECDPQRGYPSAADLPRDALLVATTHDLPTLAGWWEGRDLVLRAELGLIGDAAPLLHARAHERGLLLAALSREQLLPADAGVASAAQAPLTLALACAVHRYLARGPSPVMLAQLEDVLLQPDQVNLPGTTGAYANWRRKLRAPLEQWADDAGVEAFALALAGERGSAQVDAVIPRATYRVQLHSGFTFAMAGELVPYLAALGISHLYCSPFLRARAGSQHGYDIVDHASINPEIGSRADLDALVATLHRHGMSMLIDVVPNHMGVHGSDNAWWLDVLEDGPASAYAEYFDIDWQSADPSLHGRVLLPILGEQYGTVLQRHELRLAFDDGRGALQVQYFDHRLPIDPSQYGPLLRQAIALLPTTEFDAEALRALHALADAFGQLPGRADIARRAQRRRDKLALKARLAGAARAQPSLARALRGRLAAIHDAPDLAAFDGLLDAQAYRLAYWRVAGDEINYRRFFDINDLAALRMERDEVFDATHALVLSLAASGAADGLRIDHSDGLADPAAYFKRLQTRFAELTGTALRRADNRPARPLYVVTEKITAPHERLSTDWAVYGTTGYRFANMLNGLLVDPAAKSRLGRSWRAFAPDEAVDFDTLARRCRHIVMDGTLAGEISVLATALWRLARADRRTRDFTLHSLRRALADVVAAFPVYRTYIVDKVSAADRRAIDWAIGRARRRARSADASVFDFVRRVLLGSPLPDAPPDLAAQYRAFARRLQQVTAPVAAKGIEDTALYRHQRLISLNDVGGDPDVFGTPVSAFHGASRDRALHWPHTMLASSTHDAKRSEDVRARIDVISEMPAAWRLTMRRWSRMNRRLKRTVDGAPAPSRNDEYLLYQTLVGSLPIDPAEPLADYARRVEQAMLKSARESKARTSWINRDEDYEAALSSFVQTALEPHEDNLFLADLRGIAATLTWFGALNGLTLALVKGLSPGVPDYYQGHETIELSLVDPDNRRAVDYARRRVLLAEVRRLAAAADLGPALRDWLTHAPDGRAKLWVTWSVLRIRHAMESLYRHPTYTGLEVRGPRADHLVAFAVHDDRRCVVAVAPRLTASMGLAVGAAPTGACWDDTTLVWPTGLVRPAAWVDGITGRRHAATSDSWPVAELLRDFPVAALSATLT
ncbi:MAG TPA: malto-oligosyltrehalose synthase [Burkholderiaceae bacterium]|nr:malto-oligosyltrehalose synthase [Burkholderiaceae bacterium]